jgi:hypothetical protein
MKRQSTKRRATRKQDLAGKVISWFQHPNPHELTTMVDVIRRLSAWQLRMLADLFEHEIEVRAGRKDKEAMEAVLVRDAFDLNHLRMLECHKPDYYRNVNRTLNAIIPDRPKQLRDMGSASQPTMLAHLLLYRLRALKMKHDLALPTFSKATCKQWFGPLRSILEYDFGEEFESDPLFQRYWRKGTQHERTSRADVRDAIWKDIKQSIKTIAPPVARGSGTKAG